MWERIEGDQGQQWRWSKSIDQMINSKTGQMFNIQDVVLWQIDEENEQGFSRVLEKRFKWQKENVHIDIDRSWGKINGQVIGMYKAYQGQIKVSN